MLSDTWKMHVKIVKWVLQCFRGTSVTYNGFSGLVCGNCNLDFAGFLDRRRSTSTYVSKNHFGRHVGGGVIPHKIQTQENQIDVFTKPVLLEKLQWCMASLGLQHR
jgi:hypothetical protein